jgi:bifunctional UDP-N-acetylglucosamine pyrophosphorylase/glucosamine-1-phosphate N-acetyltransferase
MLVDFIILAAGKGTRMMSPLPKVLHKVAGITMLEHSLRAISQLEAISKANIWVVTSTELMQHPEAQALEKQYNFTFVLQVDPRGTGHAVQCVVDQGKLTGELAVVLTGDTPLIKTETLEDIIARAGKERIVNLAFSPLNPTGYGRLLTDTEGRLKRIVEEVETTPEQRSIRLCNAGIFAIPNKVLPMLLSKLDDRNKKGEVYLPDIVQVAYTQGIECVYTETLEEEVQGVNSKLQLSQVENAMQQRLRQAALSAGITLIAPETVFLSADVVLEPEVMIHPYVVIGTKVKVGRGAEILSFSHIQDAEIGGQAKVGPFARIRDGTKIGSNSRVGNFVEVKKSKLGERVKAAHLSYVGDADIGEATNIGAGTIFCNYDGYKKHNTKVGSEVFIGSNTAIVAPLTIEDGAIIAAGSTITKDVGQDDLAIGRSPQQILKGKAKQIKSKNRGNKQ